MKVNHRTPTVAVALIALAALTSIAPKASDAREHHGHHARREMTAHRHIRERRREIISNDADGGPQTPADMQPYMTGEYPHPESRFTCLIDASSGKVLYGSNFDARRPPASLTKIMAATVLLEDGKLSDIVTAPADVKGVPESSLHLRPGEKIDLEDLLYAMLLRSANDTPVAGASYLSGSIPKFVHLMNQKAQEEGCENTHFVTPNGLYAPGHYSSAHDLAIMARYATSHLPMFDEIVKTEEYKVDRSVDKGDTIVINTSRSFLKYFPGADGIKTGYISQAGHCFVGSATRGGFRLIAVALDSPKCREDVESMLSYGFAHFEPVKEISQGTLEGNLNLPDVGISVPVATGTDLNDVVSKDNAEQTPTYTTVLSPLPLHRIKTPISEGEVVGKVTLLADGKVVGSTDAVATQSVALPVSMSSSSFLRSRAGIAGKIAEIAVGAVAVLLCLALSALKIYAGALAKNSRRRRARLTPQMRTVD